MRFPWSSAMGEDVTDEFQSQPAPAKCVTCRHEEGDHRLTRINSVPAMYCYACAKAVPADVVEHYGEAAYDDCAHPFKAQPEPTPRCVCGHAKDDMPRESHYFGDGFGMRTFCMVESCPCQEFRPEPTPSTQGSTAQSVEAMAEAYAASTLAPPSQKADVAHDWAVGYRAGIEVVRGENASLTARDWRTAIVRFEILRGRMLGRDDADGVVGESGMERPAHTLSINEIDGWLDEMRAVLGGSK